MALVEITFTGWEKWNPRKDVKHPAWFALSNRIVEDDQIQELNDAEFRAFIYLICLASQKNSPTISVNVQKAERILGCKAQVVENTITKLVAYGICTGSVRDLNASVRDLHATLQDKTLQDKTREGVDCIDLPPLARVWNQHRGKLAEVKKTNSTRNRKAAARWKEAPESEWVEVVQKIAVSPFCCGQNDRAWQATFDWLLQPETRLKVLEGKYNAVLSNKNAVPFNESIEDWKSRMVAEHEAREAARAQIRNASEMGSK